MTSYNHQSTGERQPRHAIHNNLDDLPRPQRMSPTIMALVGGVLSVGGVYGGVQLYRHGKDADIIAQTNAAVATVQQHAHDSLATIDANAFILVTGEQNTLKKQLSAITDRLPDVQRTVADALALSDIQQRRALLEPGFDEQAAASGYRTPVEQMADMTSQIDAIGSICTERRSLRDLALRQELLLKTALKKPSVAMIEVPADLAVVQRHAPELMRSVPADSQAQKQQLDALGDPGLNNRLGVALVRAQRVVADIHRVAANDRVKTHASALWASAKSSFQRVKPLNDAIHWYVPEKDDGAYDAAAYTNLLRQQKPALDAIASGESYVTQLDAYRAEVYDQHCVHVSDNSWEDTTFPHSKTTYHDEPYRDSDGKRHTRRVSKTKRWNTDGRIFFYTLSTATPASVSHDRKRVGSKDSADYMMGTWSDGWKSWDYKPEETKGYLVEYKGLGTDARDIIRGGTYNPAVHILKPAP